MWVKRRRLRILHDIDMISEDLLMAEVDGDEENNIMFTTTGVMIK